ncbi:hypothetical protein KP714_07695 [Staphylococcus aureus]|nr:hypothetical protein KP714_07695 [Staphylococcus aureus]
MNGGENFMGEINKKEEITRSNPINKSFEKPGASENLKSTLSEKDKKKDYYSFIKSRIHT